MKCDCRVYDEHSRCLFCGKFSNDFVARNISKEIRYLILVEQKWTCNNCGCSLCFSKSSNWTGEVAHIDHIHPFSDRLTYKNNKENINERENLQALCPDCNRKKQRGKD